MLVSDTELLWSRACWCAWHMLGFDARHPVTWHKSVPLTMWLPELCNTNLLVLLVTPSPFLGPDWPCALELGLDWPTPLLSAVASTWAIVTFWCVCRCPSLPLFYDSASFLCISPIMSGRCCLLGHPSPLPVTLLPPLLPRSPLGLRAPKSFIFFTWSSYVSLCSWPLFKKEPASPISVECFTWAGLYLWVQIEP